MDLDNLKNDILNSDLKTKPEKNPSKLCKQYDTILQTILNKHAPLLTKTVSERPPYHLDDTINLGKSLAQNPLQVRQITLQSSVKPVQ